MEGSADVKFIFITFIGSFTVLNIVLGALTESYEGCKRNTILKRFNPPYWIGCELVKERDWK